MIIKSVELEEVKKFNKPVKISNIKSGLNVLSEVNEFGKSTIVAAIHAVLFEKYRSYSKDIKKLVSKGGGHPRVKLEIEIEGKTFFIEKIWSSSERRKEAYILNNSETIARDAEAEDWIFKNLKFSELNAPTGLLWLRQGDVNFGKWDDTSELRKTLLSSITDEIENLTGGQTMDRLLNNYINNLNKFLTKTGKPVAGSEYLEKIQKVEELNQTLRKNEELFNDLKQKLKERNSAKEKLKEYEDPETDKKNQLDFNEAQKILNEAISFEKVLAEIKQKKDLQKTKCNQLEKDILDLNSLLKEKKDDEKSLNELLTLSKEFKNSYDLENKIRDEFNEKFLESKIDLEKIEEEFKNINLAKEYQKNKIRKKELKEKIKNIDEIKSNYDEYQNKITKEVNQVSFEKIQKIYHQIDLEKSKNESEAISLKINYINNDSKDISIDGKVFQDGQKFTVLKDKITIEIKNVGNVNLNSSIERDNSKLQLLEQNLSDELLKQNKFNFEEVKASNKNFHSIMRKVDQYKTELNIKAPNGVDDFKNEFNLIPEISPDFRLDYFLSIDKEDIEKSLNIKNNEHLENSNAKDKAELRLNDLNNELRVIEGKISVITPKLKSIKEKLETFIDVHGDSEFLEKKLTNEQLIFDEFSNAYNNANSQVRTDIDSARAKFDICEQKIENAKNRKIKLKEDISRLDGLIEGMSGEGVDEIITETKDEIEKNTRDIKSFEYEIKVLKKLIQVLEEARKNARERYLNPIINELTPLLKLIWPESEINFNDDYAPSKIFRNGREELIDSLSLGTQEQISIFVRLAFAKLFANTHGSTPVILDDAIIYSDDLRIREIFTALQMQSSNYQILVFSCRQKSLEDLGGNILSIEH